MSVAILNVGVGDIKVSFERNNPAERIRACRIVRDMLRRGYVLLVEIEQPDGTKAFQRAVDFNEETAEYIIVDFDPSVPEEVPVTTTERDHEEASEAAPSHTAAPGGKTEPPRPRGRRLKSVPAETTKSVAVARTAGG